jgi:hypothetical protein
MSQIGEQHGEFTIGKYNPGDAIIIQINGWLLHEIFPQRVIPVLWLECTDFVCGDQVGIGRIGSIQERKARETIKVIRGNRTVICKWPSGTSIGPIVSSARRDGELRDMTSAAWCSFPGKYSTSKSNSSNRRRPRASRPWASEKFNTCSKVNPVLRESFSYVIWLRHPIGIM